MVVMKKLILGILLFGIAFVGPMILIAPFLSSLADGVVSFEASGELEVTVEEPDRYYVWNVHTTVYEGRSYSQSKTLPSGVTFSLTEVETGEEIPFETDLSISTTTGANESHSVGYFEVEKSGAYLLTIGGLDEPRIFAFGPSIFGDFVSIFGWVGLGLLVAFGLVIAGILLIIFGAIEMSRKKESRPAPNTLP